MTNLTDNSWSFLDNLSNDEQMLLHEATKPYAEDLGLSKREILTCNINNVKELLCEKASLDGASYETFLSSIMEGLGLDTKGDVIQNEDAIFLEMLVYVIDQCNEEQLKKYAKSNNFVYQGKDKLKEAVRLRAKASPSFNMEIPATILAPIAKSSAYLSTIPFLAISAIFVPAVAVSALLTAKAAFHFYPNLTGANKKKLILHFSYLISAIISISRASRTKFTSEDQVLEYIDGIIRNNTRWEDSKKTALSILADFCLKAGCEENEEVLSNLVEILGEDWHIIPQKILVSLDEYRDAIICSLMKKINEIDDYQEKLFDVGDFCNGKERVLFAEFKFPITPVDTRYCYGRSGEQEDPIIWCSIELYLIYKGVLSVIEFWNESQKDGFDGVCCFHFEDENEYYREEIREIIKQIPTNNIFYYQVDVADLAKIGIGLIQKDIQEDLQEYKQFITELFKTDTAEIEEFIKILEKVNPGFGNFIKVFLPIRYEIERQKKQLDHLSHIIHITKHDTAPALDHLKRIFLRNIEYNKDEVLKEVEDMSESIRDLVEVVDYINSESADLHEIVEGIIKKNNDRPYKIEFERHPQQCRVYGDTISIKKIINNVLSNAERHGFNGRDEILNKIKIDIKSIGQYIKLSISNNGHPFKGDENEVFKEGVAFGKTANTGEGLYRVYNLMQQMYGYPEFKSTPNMEYSVEVILNFKKYDEEV